MCAIKSLRVISAMLLCVVLAVLLASCSKDSAPPSESVLANVISADSWIPEGQYKVGWDFTEGEYYLEADETKYHWYRVSSDANQLNTLIHEYFYSSTYITLSSGQFIELDGARMISVDFAPTITLGNEGMYKVGRDIVPGEYRITAKSQDDPSYHKSESELSDLSIFSNKYLPSYKVLTDSTADRKKAKEETVQEAASVIVSAGQYLNVFNSTIEFVRPMSEIPATLIEDASENEPFNPGMSFETLTDKMRKAYAKVVQENKTLDNSVFSDASEMNMELVGGGLLDFTGDSVPELVLVYEGEFAEHAVVYTFSKNEPKILFDYVISNGGNWFYNSFVEKDGTASVCEYVSPYRDEDALGRGDECTWLVYENGKWSEKLRYYVYDAATKDFEYAHTYWEVSRNGTVVASGKSVLIDDDASIPQLDKFIEEAEEKYGDDWTPFDVQELLAGLAVNSNW